MKKRLTVGSVYRCLPLSIWMLLALLVPVGPVLANESCATRPNVLLIYTDDHRYSGVGVLGGQPVKTPNLDALARQGTVFTNTYLMGSFSGATCIPSRAMLLTGRQLFDLQGVGRTIPDEHTTIGEAFGRAGYQTHHVGKWHQDKKSLSRSFQSGGVVMGLGAYLEDHFRMPYWDWDSEGSFDKQNAYLLQRTETGEVKRRALTKSDKRGPTGTEIDGPHSSEVFADHAVNFLKSCNNEQPFFMYLAFHAPHDPRQAPKKYLDMYDCDEVKLPPSYQQVHPFHNGHMDLRDERLAPWPRTPDIARRQLAEYYAIITHLDAQIGRVIDTLKSKGLYENTIIVMAGDSGLAVGCHGLLGKQNLYDEDGIHVPLILAGKVNGNGRRLNSFSYIHDIFPTVCDLADIAVPESVNGKSLAPVLQGKTKQVRDHTYHAYLHYQRAYREGDFKLIEYVRAPNRDRKTNEISVGGSRVTQLFNVKQDPWETFDISFLPEHRDRIGEMRNKMRDQAVELGDRKENVEQEFDFWDYYDE